MNFALALYLASFVLYLTAAWFAPSSLWVILGFVAGFGMCTAWQMKAGGQQE